MRRDRPLSRFGSATSAVVPLGATGVQNTKGSGSDAYFRFENLTGSKCSDILQGNAGANAIRGGSGNDKLFGEAGADRLDGGTNTDGCSGGTGADTGISCESKSSL